jgi:hypothetical protein
LLASTLYEAAAEVSPNFSVHSNSQGPSGSQRSVGSSGPKMGSFWQTNPSPILCFQQHDGFVFAI